MDPNAIQELDQSRRKIARRHTADPTRIAIHRQEIWQAVLPQELDHGIKGRLGMKILVHLGGKQARGACIDEITDFNEMLSLP